VGLLGRGCSPPNQVENLEERCVSSLSGSGAKPWRPGHVERFIGLRSGSGVDFDDNYFSEIFVGSKPQNTPRTKFVGSGDPDLYGIGAYGLVLLA